MNAVAFWLWAVCGSGGVLGFFASLRYWLRLRFYRHVYDKGGPEDLAVAGEVTRPPLPRLLGAGSLPSEQPAQMQVP